MYVCIVSCCVRAGELANNAAPDVQPAATQKCAEQLGANRPSCCRRALAPAMAWILNAHLSSSEDPKVAFVHLDICQGGNHVMRQIIVPALGCGVALRRHLGGVEHRQQPRRQAGRNCRQGGYEVPGCRPADSSSAVQFCSPVQFCSRLQFHQDHATASWHFRRARRAARPASAGTSRRRGASCCRRRR